MGPEAKELALSSLKPRRRTLFGGALAAFMGFFAWGVKRRERKTRAGLDLRPPGALDEEEFLDACARCFKCGNACPNGCIKFYGIGGGLTKMFTPYIRPRDRACTLCGECGKVCPSGALKPILTDREGLVQTVKMGTARVNKAMCYSFHGRTCGACYRACPLAGTAMKIGLYETPLVQPDACVGCGLCEQACLHLPQAIRVIPIALTKES